MTTHDETPSSVVAQRNTLISALEAVRALLASAEEVASDTLTTFRENQDTQDGMWLSKDSFMVILEEWGKHISILLSVGGLQGYHGESLPALADDIWESLLPDGRSAAELFEEYVAKQQIEAFRQQYANPKTTLQYGPLEFPSPNPRPEDHLNQLNNVAQNEIRQSGLLEHADRMYAEAIEIKRNTPTPKKPDTSLVYFVQQETGGLVKIGISKNPEARIKDLQNQSPAKLKLLGLMSGGRALEDELHKKFDESRDHGEWFLPSDELLSYIQENAQ